MSSVDDHLTASVRAASGQQTPCRPLPAGDASSDGPPDLATASQPEQAFGATNLGRLLRYLHSRQPGECCRCGYQEPPRPGGASTAPTGHPGADPNGSTTASTPFPTYKEQT